MTFEFLDLDDITRNLMVSELETDIANARVYLSKVARPGSEAAYHEMLRAAFVDGDASHLSQTIAESGIIREKQDNGNLVNLADAATRLGDGQFVAYYARAVCIRAVSEGRQVEIYRGQETAAHRLESDMSITSRPDPASVLDELRRFSLEPWQFATIAKVNSGLSIKLV